MHPRWFALLRSPCASALSEAPCLYSVLLAVPAASSTCQPSRPQRTAAPGHRHQALIRRTSDVLAANCHIVTRGKESAPFTASHHWSNARLPAPAARQTRPVNHWRRRPLAPAIHSSTTHQVVCPWPSLCLATPTSYPPGIVYIAPADIQPPLQQPAYLGLCHLSTALRLRGHRAELVPDRPLAPAPAPALPPQGRIASSCLALHLLSQPNRLILLLHLAPACSSPRDLHHASSLAPDPCRFLPVLDS